MNTTNPQSAFEQYKRNCSYSHLWLKYASAETIELIKKLPPEQANEVSCFLGIGESMAEAFKNMTAKARFRPCDQIIGFLRRGLHAMMISREYEDVIQMEHDAIMLQCLIEALEGMEDEVECLLNQGQDVTGYHSKNSYKDLQKNYINYTPLLQWLSPIPEKKANREGLETAA